MSTACLIRRTDQKREQRLVAVYQYVCTSITRRWRGERDTIIRHSPREFRRVLYIKNFHDSYGKTENLHYAHLKRTAEHSLDINYTIEPTLCVLFLVHLRNCLLYRKPVNYTTSSVGQSRFTEFSRLLLEQKTRWSTPFL